MKIEDQLTGMDSDQGMIMAITFIRKRIRMKARYQKSDKFIK